MERVGIQTQRMELFWDGKHHLRGRKKVDKFPFYFDIKRQPLEGKLDEINYWMETCLETTIFARNMDEAVGHISDGMDIRKLKL